MDTTKYDVIIIGAGPGGYPCAIRLAQLQKKVLVIEAKELGGLCLNQGCIPTKALGYAAELTESFKKAKKLGFDLEYRGYNLEVLRSWKNSVVMKLRKGVEYLFKSNKIVLKKGFAKVIDEHQVVVETTENKEVFQADFIVIATGTRVASLPGFEFDHNFIIDTSDALELSAVPGELLVVGAGASGLEMAGIYQHLGSKVTVVEIMEQILPGMETELCTQLKRLLEKQGIKIHLNARINGWRKEDNRVEVSIKEKDREFNAFFDKILVTVGRRPDDSAFKDISIEKDKKGFIIVDKEFRTNIKHIFAIGDIIGPPLLAHKATHQGIMVAELIGGGKIPAGSKNIPSCVFTIPPFSSVGLTESQAKDKGYAVKTGKFPFRACGKALAMEEPEGMVKIVGDETGRLLGLHILGAESSSLIGEAVIALDNGLSVEDLASSIHPHPTLTEPLCEAAENFYKKAIHIINR